MTNLLSSVSGYFSKSLILGTLFPVLFFTLLGLLIVPELIPDTYFQFSLQDSFGSDWTVLSITLIIVVSSAILYDLNIQLIRAYEGYPWKDSWIGKRRVERYKKEFDITQSRSKGIRNLLNYIDDNEALPQPKFTNAQVRTIWTFRVNQTRKLINQFPKNKSSILPTRLGNIIRSFEDYSSRQYGIRSITMWPRLISQIDLSYAASLDSAKATFDFMINCSALSGLLGMVILGLGLIFPSQIHGLLDFIIWILEIGGFLIFAYQCYAWSIQSAEAWGNLVKGAFDLYRNKLLKELGYSIIPKDKLEERIIWEKIYYQMAFGDSSKGPRISYSIPPETKEAETYANGDPTSVDLIISKGVNQTEVPCQYNFCIEITNDSDQICRNVTLNEQLNPEFVYEWGSAKSNKKTLSVKGVNPYKILVGDIPPKTSIVINYNAIQISSSRDQSDSSNTNK